MKADYYSSVRQNLKKYCDMAVEQEEVILVKRKENKDVVILSLEKYNELLEIVRESKQ